MIVACSATASRRTWSVRPARARRGPCVGGLDGAAEQRLDAHLGQAARLQTPACHVWQLTADDQQPDPVPAHRLAERIAHLAGGRGEHPRGPVEPAAGGYSFGGEVSL